MSSSIVAASVRVGGHAIVPPTLAPVAVPAATNAPARPSPAASPTMAVTHVIRYRPHGPDGRPRRSGGAPVLPRHDPPDLARPDPVLGGQAGGRRLPGRIARPDLGHLLMGQLRRAV